MDILDNLIYASLNSQVFSGTPLPGTTPTQNIFSDYIPRFTVQVANTPRNVGLTNDPVFVYDGVDRMNFCAYPDPDIIETSILRHWHDVNNQVCYDADNIVRASGPPPGTTARLSSFRESSTYHLIFAYLTENTRLLQIFERLLEKYLYDEEFGIADDPLAFNWIQNTERLFFKNDSYRPSNIRSLIRPSSDSSRRNAYWRMFGMDLAFGDINSQVNASSSYFKAKSSNQQFVPFFEKYLSEVWQAYMNARNTSGPNSSDINILTDLATDLQELLRARRGNTGTNSYANLNLSREEFSSVLLTSWFTFIISDDTPIVQFLNCQSSTIGERLQKIGVKVGIPAHGKCQSLFEMAGAAANILTRIEDGNILDDQARMNDILASLDPTTPGTDEDVNLMSDLLTLINNWEKATGHKIKNPEGNITGTVKIQQNGVQRSQIATRN